MPEDNLAPYNYDEPANSRPELSAAPFDKRPIIIAAAVALGFFLLATLCGVWLYWNPAKAEIIRDIFIIYVGMGIFVLIPLLIVLSVVLTYLILKVNDLVNLLQREILPILLNTQESVNTIKGTTTFLSDQAVQPVIKTAGTVAAVRTITRSLFKRK
jgi:hypothetical protein